MPLTPGGTSAMGGSITTPARAHAHHLFRADDGAGERVARRAVAASTAAASRPSSVIFTR